jgi:hypothetical protein
LVQRPLDGSLARAQDTRERRGWPRFATLKQSDDRAGRSINRRSQHDDGRGLDGGERETTRRRLNPGKWPKGSAQAAKLDAEPRPVRVIDGAGLEGATGTVDLGDQRRDTGGDGSCLSAVERSCGVRDPDAAERDLGGRIL